MTDASRSAHSAQLLPVVLLTGRTWAAETTAGELGRAR